MADNLFGEYRYDDPAKWQKDHDAWVAGGKQGPEPTISAGGKLATNLGFAGFSPQIPNSTYWQQAAQTGANAPLNANPYSNAVADQSRGAQLALLAQMRAMQQGPSLAALQTQRALAQSGQSALGAAAMGAPGRAAMMQAGQVGGGLAGDAGQARLAEVMRMQAAQGGLAGGLRGNDINSAGLAQRFGNQQLQMDLGNRLGYAGLGARQAALESNAGLEFYKAIQKANLAQREKELNGLKTGFNIAAPIVGGLATANLK